jgi:hypothetical protein
VFADGRRQTHKVVFPAGTNVVTLNVLSN